MSCSASLTGCIAVGGACCAGISSGRGSIYGRVEGRDKHKDKGKGVGKRQRWGIYAGYLVLYPCPYGVSCPGVFERHFQGVVNQKIYQKV
jgi:hypothetical protein